MKTYFLSSLDSAIFAQTRKCSFLRKLYFDTGKECVLAKISPPIIGQHFGSVDDIDFVILANRHEGENLFPINNFPCFVFITRILIDDLDNKKTLTKSDLEIIGWGELYRTKSDADNHIFSTDR